jgi:hypothetical protein
MLQQAMFHLQFYNRARELDNTDFRLLENREAIDVQHLQACKETSNAITAKKQQTKNGSI